MTTLTIFAFGCWVGFAVGMLCAGASRVLIGPAATYVGRNPRLASERSGDLSQNSAGVS